MIDLHRILVPTDFSQQSHNALKYAAAFADKFGAELYLLHVVQDLSLFLPDAISGTPPYLPPADQMMTVVRESLDRLAREQLASLKVHCLVREGPPFVEIITCARENDIDLIIMGTHGRGILAHMLMGSVAEKVVRKAPCPVLTVRDPEHEFVHP
ncbi:MAG TPA: universal stress protein [Gemmataceae bacterium]|nr:universal stress protein [Gemmataceae bacterium]